ncbi:hypothetical protein GCM10007963_06880 [Lutibacter litoralis]|nr:hypothetical protein GCM10007963_06880 [Lutibacter litoralis]
MHKVPRRNPINRNKLNIYKIFSDIDSYIMWGEIDRAIEFKGFDEYMLLVLKGELYEYLEHVFVDELGEEFKDRESVKSVVFEVLFTDNRFIGQKGAEKKRLFKKKFTEVYNLFSILKRKNKTVLPILLQRIESYLIIDVIAKRISKEIPEAPIFTIHDSITTTEEYYFKVRKIMDEELTLAVGFKPSLKREEWCKSNIEKYLEELRGKKKSA